MARAILLRLDRVSENKMITTVAELLEKLRSAEADLIRKQDIKHGPTIGYMYEGLTCDILDRAIPPTLGLKVVEGFVEGNNGTKSNQVDLMLVSGEGRRLPYTNKFVWNIKNVLAVFEVKKTLYGSTLADSFNKMLCVTALHSEFNKEGGYVDKDVRFGHKNFARLTGYYPEIADIINLPPPLPVIHYSILSEQLAPVRVILGYEGYVNEKALRSGIQDFIQTRGVGAHFGFLSLPTLIICRNNSVIKLNGYPYYQRMSDKAGWWEVMASNSENPTLLLLELIWTKISAETGTQLPMDDSLNLEKFSPFLGQKYIEREIDGVVQKGFAWAFSQDLHKGKEDSVMPEWQPEEADTIESVTLYQASSRGYISTADASFIQFLTQYGRTPKDVLTSMVQKRILAWIDAEHTKARLIEETLIVFTPQGQTLVTEQSDLLGLWTEKILAQNRKSY